MAKIQIYIIHIHYKIETKKQKKQQWPILLNSTTKMYKI